MQKIKIFENIAASKAIGKKYKSLLNHFSTVMYDYDISTEGKLDNNVASFSFSNEEAGVDLDGVIKAYVNDDGSIDKITVGQERFSDIQQAIEYILEANDYNNDDEDEDDDESR